MSIEVDMAQRSCKRWFSRAFAFTVPLLRTFFPQFLSGSLFLILHIFAQIPLLINLFNSNHPSSLPSHPIILVLFSFFYSTGDHLYILLIYLIIVHIPYWNASSKIQGFFLMFCSQSFLQFLDLCLTCGRHWVNTS